MGRELGTGNWALGTGDWERKTRGGQRERADDVVRSLLIPGSISSFPVANAAPHIGGFFFVLSTLLPMTPPSTPPTTAPITPAFTLLRLVVAPMTAPAAAPMAAS